MKYLSRMAIISSLLAMGCIAMFDLTTPAMGEEHWLPIPYGGVHLGDGIEQSQLQNGYKGAACAPAGISNKREEYAADADADWYFVRNDYGKTETASNSFSLDASAGIPFVAEADFHASGTNTSQSQFQKTTVHFIEAYTEELATSLAQGSIPFDNAGYAVYGQCGSKYVSAIKYGASVLVDMELANSASLNSEMSHSTMSAGGSGVVADVVDLKGDYKSDAMHAVEEQLSSTTAHLYIRAFGAPAFVATVQSLNADATLNNVGSLAAPASKIQQKVDEARKNSATIGAPYAMQLQPYPGRGREDEAAQKSDEKLIALTEIAKAGIRTARLRDHIYDLRNDAAWSTLQGTAKFPNQQSLTNAQKAMSEIIGKLNANYYACLHQPLKNYPKKCTPDPGYQKLAKALGLDATYGLPQPPKFSGAWLSSNNAALQADYTVAWDAKSPDAQHQDVPMQALIWQKFEMTRTTMSQGVELRTKVGNDSTYSIYSSLASFPTVNRQLELMSWRQCPQVKGGQGYLIGDRPPYGFSAGIWQCQPDQTQSLVDLVEHGASGGLTHNASTPAHSDVILRFTTLFGQYCAWPIASMSWSPQGPLNNGYPKSVAVGITLSHGDFDQNHNCTVPPVFF